MATLEPPAFISGTKSYGQYKKDLQMWSRITQVDKKLQAELVVYKLEGHPSGIKEKILTALDGKLAENEKGIDELIKFLDEIYLQDEMADAWEKYKSFEEYSYDDKSLSMAEFISEWHTRKTMAKTSGCDYSDSILAFKLLEKANLGESDVKVVLTQVDYKEKGNLLYQMETSLKKFHSRHPIISQSKPEKQSGMKVDETLIADIEEALVAKGWQKPRPRKRSNTDPGERPKASSNYKGKKNPLGKDGKPLRCFKCDSEYHLSPKCKKQVSSQEEQNLFSTNKDQVEKDYVFGPYNVLVAEDSISKEEECEDYIVLVAEEETEICFMIQEARNKGLIDCGCSKTVAGRDWLKTYISQLSDVDKQRITYSDSSRIYKFGGGEQKKSLHCVKFPALIGDQKVFITSEVVESPIPLLLGSNFLKRSGATINFELKEGTFLGHRVDLDETKSGHYCLNILAKNLETHINDQKKREEAIFAYAAASETVSMKDVEKLHHYFGHISTDRLYKLLQQAGKASGETKKQLEKIRSECIGCIRFANSAPKPKVAAMRCQAFNEIVTLDLKDMGSDSKDKRYVLYLIDLFSRFTVASFIPSKEPRHVIDVIMKKWIGAGFGVMQTIHSDRGGEFTAKEVEDMARNLNIQVTNTAALSPNQNGICERNHAVVDKMVSKMMESDRTLDAETALCWAMNAKNTLENHQGFSPAQLVFGRNPTLQTILNGTPATWENKTISQTLAKNLEALHSAREEFIKAESDRIIRSALKDRVYPKGNDIVNGDYVYFKQNKDKMWQGPNKVIATNGKTLYVDVCGRINAVNRDDSTKTSEVLLQKEVKGAGKDPTFQSSEPPRDNTEVIRDLNIPNATNVVDREDGTDQGLVDNESREDNTGSDDVQSLNYQDLDPKDLKKG